MKRNMDFKLLTHAELQEFVDVLGPQYGYDYDRWNFLYVNAQKLFELIQEQNGNVSLPVADLQVATKFRTLFPKYAATSPLYTEEEIRNLSQQQVNQFLQAFGIQSMGDIELDKTRIVRILRILDLLEIPEGKVGIRGGIPVNDSDGLVVSIPNELFADRVARMINEKGSKHTLFSLVSKGDISELATLLSTGLDPNFGDALGAKPLFLAADHPEKVKLLIQAGAGVHPIAPLIKQHAPIDMITQMLKKGADPNSGLKAAIDLTSEIPPDRTRENYLRLLKEYGADPHFKIALPGLNLEYLSVSEYAGYNGDYYLANKLQEMGFD